MKIKIDIAQAEYSWMAENYRISEDEQKALNILSDYISRINVIEYRDNKKKILSITKDAGNLVVEIDEGYIIG